MGRMLRGSVALAIGVVVVLSGAAAQAQVAFPPYPGDGPVTVTPTEVTSGGADIKVTGPGMPGQDGCSAGQVRLVRPAATTLEGSILLGSGDFDAKLEASNFARNLPLATGEYSIVISCSNGRGDSAIYSTTATITVTNGATTIPTTTTLPTTTSSSTVAPPTGQATVEPNTAKPGIDTITIRGSGFKPGAELTITLDTTPATKVGTIKALPDGQYANTLKLPASSPPGTHKLVVTGPGPDDVTRSTSATITVQKLTCGDFTTPRAAQSALAGGNDPHSLDPERDGVACGTVSARSATGGSATPAASSPSGTLPATGPRHAPVGVMAGLTAMTVGALLMGLSHPAAPAGGHHRRRRHWS